jgi:phosphonate transport system permease protein
MTAAEIVPQMRGPDTRAAVRALFRRKRLLALGLPALVMAYFTYIFFAFDLPGLADRARLDNAAILVADTYSYKTHVTRDNRRETLTIAIEGEARGAYPPGAAPDWVTLGQDSAVVTLPRGASVVIEGPESRFDIPGYGMVIVTAAQDGVSVETPDGTIPDFINASPARATVTTPMGRLSVTRARTEVLRYAPGWELFFFTLDSPFHGRSFTELLGLAVSGPRIVEEKSNIAAMAGDFWNNQMWHHRDVFWALFETVLMAFLGTMGAAMIALPLAFMAAANFGVSRLLRFGLRRVFDLLRGVDALIWTIVLSRAFGPGPMTGALAILLTDSGTFGKLFSEALENVDDGQIEGVASTGARPLQRYRFGVIPQIMPVLLSQTLYYLESNTRSATIIGAIVGGGIGLLLTQAIITQKDWEEVSYYIILIVLLVMLMDTLSGWLRRRLIKGV